MSATYEIEKNAKASKSMSLVVDKVTVSKQDVTTKKELPGATLQIKDSSGNIYVNFEGSRASSVEYRDPNNSPYINGFVEREI